MHNPGIKSNILPIKATSSCVMTDKSCGRFLPKLNSGSFRGKTANRKLQFTVTRLQFQNAGISNISKVLFFEVHHFNLTKTGIMQLFEFKTSQTDKES